MPPGRMNPGAGGTPGPGFLSSRPHNLLHILIHMKYAKNEGSSVDTHLIFKSIYISPILEILLYLGCLTLLEFLGEQLNFDF